MIFIQEIKQSKTELRAIDETKIVQMHMVVKDIGGKDKRSWTLTFSDGSTYSIPDDATYLHGESSPEFNELLGQMADILKV